MGEKLKLSRAGFEYHLNNVEHETNMFKTYGFKSSKESVEWSKEILMRYFDEKEMDNKS